MVTDVVDKTNVHFSNFHHSSRSTHPSLCRVIVSGTASFDMSQSNDKVKKSSPKAKNLKEEEERQETPPLSSKEMISSISPYDKTVEIVGLVAEIEAAQRVGIQNDKIRFRFLLSNDEGTKIQVTCWNDQAERIEPLVHSNDVLHIMNITAKPVSRKYNWHGTFDIELIPDSRTQLNVYKRTLPAAIASGTPQIVQLVELKEAAKYENLIRVRGYVKSAFALFEPAPVQKGPSYGHGAITDGIFKLEVKFISFTPSHSFERGDFVEILGCMQQHLNPIQILVQGIDDIKRIDGPPISPVKLISGSLPLPLKRAESDV